MDYDSETEAEFDELVGHTIKAVRMVPCHGNYGESNGYYSESVSFYRVLPEGP